MSVIIIIGSGGEAARAASEFATAIVNVSNSIQSLYVAGKVSDVDVNSAKDLDRRLSVLTDQLDEITKEANALLARVKKHPKK